MRGKILLQTLELLRNEAMTQVDFFVAVLTAGYGASFNKIEYEYQKKRRIRENKKHREEVSKDRKRKLTIFISKMKHDGLIRKSEDGKFRISIKGQKKISELKNGLPSRHYEVSDIQGNPVICSFDIPEQFRRKRDWLREVLKNLGFKMVHQSVWIGKTRVPETFVEDLERIKILEFVEIFEISKTGSLKKLT